MRKLGFKQAMASALTLVIVGCELPAEVPDKADPLTVKIAADTRQQPEGTEPQWAASAAGGQPPYFFRWDLNSGPEEVAIAGPTAESISAGPLMVPGRYVFRVLVADSAGNTARDFGTIQITELFVTEVPRLAVMGDETPLAVTAQTDLQATFAWEIIAGSGVIEDAATPEARLITEAPETLQISLTITRDAGLGDSVTESEEFSVVSVEDISPRVEVQTRLGPFVIEFEGEAAPLHTANFLQYVDQGFYDGLLIHRVACFPDVVTGGCDPFVIQGGGFERMNDELVMREPTQEPVESEADNGLTNSELLTVSLALASAPGTGTSQFFVNLRDNGSLDDLGFTVFARVAEGAEVIEAIAAVEVETSPIITSEESLPVEDVVIQRIIRLVEE